MIDQVPVEGNPVNVTLPVGTVQVGCTTVPITGAVGVAGFGFTVTTVAADTHPVELLAVRL